jgi:hypothetical protein
MKGFSRTEFIIVNDEPYMLEMNTVPGLTTGSLIPQAIAGGIHWKICLVILSSYLYKKYKVKKSKTSEFCGFQLLT